MKDYIFGEFVNKVENDDDIKNIIMLINCLENKSKLKDNEEDNMMIELNAKQEENEQILNEFLKRLMEKNTFTKEEFFTDNNNIKISLLLKLNEAKIIKESDEEYYENIINLLKDIKEDIDGNIRKIKLEEFLKNDKKFIINRMSLINLLYDNYKPRDEYESLNNKFNEINKVIVKLRNVKDNIIIYYKDLYKDLIKELIEVTNHSQNKQIKYYKSVKIKELIQKCDALESTNIEINRVKDFLLFNVIYEKYNTSNDEGENFKKANEELEKIRDLLKQNKDVNKLYENENYKDIIDKIREKLSNKEEKANEFIVKFMEYYEICNDENLKSDLNILFKSKKYELDINSIIFFFKYFDEKNQNPFIPDEYKDLSKKSFNDIKKILKELKTAEKYDYENVQNYNKLFTCLKDKKEAIDYLFSKKEEDIENLVNRLEPTNRTIKIEDIMDTKECVYHITKMKGMNVDERFSYIKGLNEIISKFMNYSKKYLSIIELDRYYDDSENIYEQVKSIINKELILNILPDSENFLYYDNDGELKRISMEILLALKNKIPPLSPKGENDGNDKIKLKHEKLLFFKDIISNLETIIEYMKVLRAKGSSLKIKICIKVEKMDKIKYELGNEEVSFKYIRNYLINVKNNYISQLDSMYKDKVNLRFFYGKQFRSIIKHLETGFNIDSFLRYILNSYADNILEGYKTIIREAKDFINQYELYSKNSLDSISMYITSLFEKNGKTLEEHYYRMKLIQNNKYKGIYLHKCENNSMEKYILDLFWNKMKVLPIAQNILITNKETSSEEIQSFFHRAILCNYNTLFVVELNNSFSENQQSIMNSYIDQLLLFKSITKKLLIT